MRLFSTLVATAWLAAAVQANAQSLSAEIQTAGGLHTAVFASAQGRVEVAIAGDAAPGDTISGTLVVEPAGASPQERQRHADELRALVVEWADQRTPVADGRYRWTIPRTLRSGVVVLTLRTGEGRAVVEARIPVDGVPAPVLPPTPAAPAFELPTDVQIGQPAVIRGPMDGLFAGKQVRVGDRDADLLAASPRRLVFQVPATQVGEVPLRMTANNRGIAGTVRVLSVRVTATRLELSRNQKATLTVLVTGLKGMAAPVTLVLNNASADVVRVEGGDTQTVAIAPRQIRPDGSFVLTRGVTGVRLGPFRVTAVVAPPPLALFDVPRAADAVLTTWQAATGIRIAAPARALIQLGVLEARPLLEPFLAQQQASRGDVRDLFAAVLSQYCFDLRDDTPPAVTSLEREAPGVRRVAFAQGAPPRADIEIDADDVQRLSFRASLSRLIERLSGSQPVGYLFVSSVPASAGITIDGQRKSETTNRRFVTSTGDHAIVIAVPGRTCQQRVQVAAFQISVVACEP